jgi:hypothetical protein
LKENTDKNQNEENNKKIQNEFIFGFTLHQNSINIDKFNDNLKHVYNIFNLKYNSIQCRLKRQLHKRNLTVILFNEKTENNIISKNKIQKNHQVLIVDC